MPVNHALDTQGISCPGMEVKLGGPAVHCALSVRRCRLPARHLVGHQEPAGHARALPRPLGAPSLGPEPSSAGCGTASGSQNCAETASIEERRKSMGEPGGTPGAASGGTPGGAPAGGYSPATLAAKVSGQRAMAPWEGGQRALTREAAGLPSTPRKVQCRTCRPNSNSQSPAISAA